MFINYLALSEQLVPAVGRSTVDPSSLSSWVRVYVMVDLFVECVVMWARWEATPQTEQMLMQWVDINIGALSGTKVSPRQQR